MTNLGSAVTLQLKDRDKVMEPYRPLRSLSVGDVRSALGQLTSRYSTRSLQITRTSLDRAIRHAQCNDLVGRNVAALVQPPRGRTGRPSKSFSLRQAKALLAAAEGTRMHAYVALSLLVGIRTEEARALRWDHVIRWVDDADGWQPITSAGFDVGGAGEDRFAIYVWRSQRYGGDTKTGKSRRTLALPRHCVDALRGHRKLQAEERLRAGAMAGSWPCFRDGPWRATHSRQCHPRVPHAHQEGRSGRGLGASGDEAYVRFGPIRQRRFRGEHRATRRARPHEHHGAGLPP
jgi:integrase